MKYLCYNKDLFVNSDLIVDVYDTIVDLDYGHHIINHIKSFWSINIYYVFINYDDMGVYYIRFFIDGNLYDSFNIIKFFYEDAFIEGYDIVIPLKK